MLEIELIPVLDDNYIYLVHSYATGETAAIDPAVSAPVQQVLEQKGWYLTHIFNTHHHHDHVGGNLDLKRSTHCQVYGAAADAYRIPGIDKGYGENDQFIFGDEPVQIIEVPGHTIGHIAFWLPESEALFCGDTLFSMGCGRLFEGSPSQMWSSLQKLAALPDTTRVYCAHEYTLANGQFALSLESTNTRLNERVEEVIQLRKNNQPTVPSSLIKEKETNPFLRVSDKSFTTQLGIASLTTANAFAYIREAKDHF